MTRIARNHRGYRIGEHHQRARLTDNQVKAMRIDHERGGFGYERLAKRYACGISTARDICTYRTRWSA